MKTCKHSSQYLCVCEGERKMCERACVCVCEFVSVLEMSQCFIMRYWSGGHKKGRGNVLACVNLFV